MGNEYQLILALAGGFFGGVFITVMGFVLFAFAWVDNTRKYHEPLKYIDTTKYV